MSTFSHRLNHEMFELYLNVWWNCYCNSVKLFTPNGVNVITIKMQLGFNPWNTSQITAEVFWRLVTTRTRENARKFPILKDHTHWLKANTKAECNWRIQDFPGGSNPVWRVGNLLFGIYNENCRIRHWVLFHFYHQQKRKGSEPVWKWNRISFLRFRIVNKP